MKVHLKSFLLVLFFIFCTHSLFTNVPIGNFTFSGLNMSEPHIIVDGSGTKVLLWTKFPSQLQIHNINGTLLCSFDSQDIFKNIIWPSNSDPLIEYVFDYIISFVDEETCETTKSYNISQIVKIPLEDYSLDKLVWMEGKSILLESGRNSVYEIDLVQQKLLNSYKVNNSTFGHLIQRSVYSGDFKYLYVQNFDMNEVAMTIKIFDAKNHSENPIKNVTMPSSIQIESITPARDNQSIILYGLSNAGYSRNIFTLDSAGNILTKITKSFCKYVTIISDTNLFDTAVFFYPSYQKIELARIMDQKTLQIIHFQDIAAINDIYYNNKTMALLLNTSQVVTYSYLSDQLDPNPDEERTLPIVWIIVGVVLGVIVIGAVVFLINKKKKLFKKQDENYGKIQDEV